MNEFDDGVDPESRAEAERLDSLVKELKRGEELVREEVLREAKTLALAMIERLGRDSPASIVVIDSMFFRSICEDYIARHPLVEAFAIAKTAEELRLTLDSAVILCSSENPTTLTRVIRAGLFGAIIEAMAAFKADAGVLSRSCCLVGTIATDPSIGLEMARAGLVEAVVSSARSFKANPLLVDDAMSAIWNLCVSNTVAQERIASSGGIEVILAAISAHPDDPMVLRSGCGALWVANNLDENVEATILHGGIEVIIRAMRRFPGQPIPQEFTLLSLEAICCKPKGASRVAELGGISAILGILKEIEDSQIQAIGCLVLALILSTPALYSKLMCPEIEQAVQHAQDLFPDSDRIKRSAGSIRKTIAPAIARAISEGVCTLVYSGKTFIQQRIFECVTCTDTRGQTFCEVCFRRHHRGHTGNESFISSFCDCELADCKVPH